MPSFSPPIHLIKLSMTIIAPILCNIFNHCFIAGVFPDVFKSAEVIPIFKSGEKTNISNWRPICLLCPYSKLFEKCIDTRLRIFLPKTIYYTVINLDSAKTLLLKTPFFNFMNNYPKTVIKTK